MPDVSEMTFEQAYTALAEIVKELDTGELTLEQTLALYEDGQLLAQHCQQLLDEAELRVVQVTETGS
jgi:exodeoxyribonuclease VII small subunit